MFGLIKKIFIRLLTGLQSFAKYTETNSSFHVKILHHGKSLISVFQEFFASINNIFILAGTLGTRLSFYEVWTLS